jgi:ABC-type lipoprotein release transport system permease subunit
VKIPLIYNIRSMKARPVSTLLTALGIALVVAVFIGMLALANGFAAALVRTGSDQNVLVLRKGADSEMSSSLDRQAASILGSMPHVARGSDGRALASAESYVVIALGRIQDTSAMANVVVRGVSEQAWQVRSNVSVTEGRRPALGKNEICVGKKLLGRFPSTDIGQSMFFAGRPWEVVCHFAAGG